MYDSLLLSSKFVKCDVNAIASTFLVSEFCVFLLTFDCCIVQCCWPTVSNVHWLP